MTPLGSGILVSPTPPNSARYKSFLNMASEFTPLPSLVEATLATNGEPNVVEVAPVIFIMSPDLI